MDLTEHVRFERGRMEIDNICVHLSTLAVFIFLIQLACVIYLEDNLE